MWTFRKISIVCLLLSILMGNYLVQNSMNKEEYSSVTGYIEFLDSTYKDHPSRHMGKYRYLKLSGYNYPFELFIGNDAGDFKPKFEQIDNLKQHDLVTTYYYETEDTFEDQLNRFAQFIDKNEDSYYEKGNSHRVLGYIVISFWVLMTAGSYVLYKKGIIPF